MGIVITCHKVEKSPTEKAHCLYCGKLIKEGLPRVAIIRNVRFLNSCGYYCYKCAEIRMHSDIINLKNEIKDLGKLKIDLKKCIKDCAKEIIAESL